MFNRTQETLANRVKSNSLPATSGVLQGSVLGPLLFLVYVNNMSKVLNDVTYCLYADDTVLYLSENDVGDIVRILQKELDK